jgi:hypothetical protein
MKSKSKLVPTGRQASVELSVEKEFDCSRKIIRLIKVLVELDHPHLRQFLRRIQKLETLPVDAPFVPGGSTHTTTCPQFNTQNHMQYGTHNYTQISTHSAARGVNKEPAGSAWAQG